MDELHFEGLGGTNTLRYTRAREAPRARVLIAPALGLRAAYYREVAEALAAADH